MVPEEPSQRNEWKVQLIVEVKVEVEAPMTKISPPTESPESRVQSPKVQVGIGSGAWAGGLGWLVSRLVVGFKIIIIKGTK